MKSAMRQGMKFTLKYICIPTFLYLYRYIIYMYISNEYLLSWLGEDGAEPTFHNIKGVLCWEKKGKGSSLEGGGGGGGQTKLCELFS